MIGIPIELYLSFPNNATTILLTQDASFDPHLVDEIKQQLMAGKTVVMTSGLWHALESKGAQDLAKIRYTDHKVSIDSFIGAFGSGAGSDLSQSTSPILIPHLRFITNDSWPVIRGIGNKNGFPILLMNQYGNGKLYVLTIPENFSDLYLIPAGTLNAIRSYVMGDFPVRIDAPAKVSLFAYDNKTFIVESFRDEPADVTVLATNANSLTDVVSGQSMSGVARKGRHPAEPAATAFNITLPPHSYRVFQTTR